MLSGHDWIYLLSLLVPLVVYNLALKIVRISFHTEAGGVFDALGLIRSDVLFNLGYVLLWIGLFALARQGLLRWAIVILFHAVTLPIFVITSCAHFYYEATGSVLGFNVVLFSFTNFGEIQAIISSVASPQIWALIVVVTFYAIVGPWLVVRTFYQTGERSLNTRPVTVSRSVPLGVCLAAVALGVLSLPVNSSGASRSFSRDAVVNIFASELDHMRYQRAASSSHEAARPKLEDTNLEQTSKAEKRNVVLIHLESVRARSVTPYNRDLETTPFLDELAKKSLLSERAYTTLPHTSKAVTSVNCGIEPHLTREVTEAQPNGIPARCLPELLNEQGYNTAMFQSATGEFEDRGRLVENFGYNEFYPLETMSTEGFERSNYFGYEDEIMLEPSRRWLEEHRDKPFLVTYLGVTGHHDYLPISRYGSQDFADDETINRYQNSVHYLDSYVETLVEQYKEMGLYENTIFIIYGDHGEGFGKHDLYQHDNTIYEEGIRIPLVVHDPKRFQSGERAETLTSVTDLLPTVADLLGYKITGGEYPGRSLLAAPDKNRTLFFSCFDEYRCLASLKGNKKYIYFFGNQPDELYDLSEDPLESRNIANEVSSEEIKERREKLLSWFSGVNAMYE